ncbi:MAG: hypothetical protein HS102_07930 [Planctomycetia bacterium]|nr:MAG: hypothetical protein EDM74_06660 [Armatimonadota bacterium]MBE7456543.1 hypothetical protein [Planctomycetia bacterium]
MRTLEAAARDENATAPSRSRALANNWPLRLAALLELVEHLATRNRALRVAYKALPRFIDLIHLDLVVALEIRIQTLRARLEVTSLGDSGIAGDSERAEHGSVVVDVLVRDTRLALWCGGQELEALSCEKLRFQVVQIEKNALALGQETLADV